MIFVGDRIRQNLSNFVTVIFVTIGCTRLALYPPVGITWCVLEVCMNQWFYAQNLKNDTSGQTENGVTMAMILTEKTVWQPLLVNVCLISVQQLSGFDSLTSKLRLTFYGKLPAAIGAQIPFTAAVISFQVGIFEFHRFSGERIDFAIFFFFFRKQFFE